MKNPQPKPKKYSQKVIDESLADFALRMGLHCVRNTVIETYHTQGKLSDAEMKAFNKEVVNNLYTFLQIQFNPKYEEWYKLAFAGNKGHHPVYYKPHDWDPPESDERTIKAFQILKDLQERDNTKSGIKFRKVKK